MRPLDPLTIPLKGRRLIEASAGTGKTYCIVLFYLRLLLEHQLTVDRILVVTFTIAATEELRHRIRSRIREALDILEGRYRDDPLLAELLEKSGADPGQAARLLADALTCMDEAAIHTIHGFCQRMLQDHAFESGVPFAIEFLESERPLRRQIIEDFWRRRFYPVPPAEAAWAEKNWHDPAGLLAALEGPLLNRTAEPAVCIDSAALAAQRKRVEALLGRIRRSWPAEREEVRKILEKDSCLRRAANSYRDDRVETTLTAMDQLAADSGPVWEPAPELSLLARSVMNTHLKRNCQPADHPFFHLFDEFHTALQRLLADSRMEVLLAAREYLLAELSRRKAEQDRMYFDDLLLRLQDALAADKGGERLAARIRSRFPVALVDEFQDTDPIQYRIFSAIYPRQEGCLLMIGDPKQAIYSFRGADIFTYIRARRETPDRARYTMTTNHRSSKAMVQAVNRLFAAPASFVFADDIPFTPVNAPPHPPAPFLLDDHEPQPLQCLYLAPELATRPGKPIAKEQAMIASAQLCAGEIASLLALAGEERALLGGRPLRAADIAILVRTHREADTMRQALAECGLSSVYSSRESIFASPEALQMHRLLAVMAAPGDEALVRGLLASDLIGLDGNELERLQDDAPALEELLAGLREGRQILVTQGFLPMFQHLLAAHSLVRRLSARPAGERKLTNYLHLAELLQQAWDGTTGPDRLLRWLSLQISDPDQDADSQQLRLESDENLVHIVTIHKAKGLEYPLVFLPFAWSGRTMNGARPFAFHRAEDLQLMADPGSDDPAHLQQARQELLAEELRLFYVAITRARNCCWFCWGRVSQMEYSAPAWLLHRNDDGQVHIGDDQTLQDDLLAIGAAGDLLRLHRRPADTSTSADHGAPEPPEPRPRRFSGRIDTGWRISSYTQLVATDHESGGARFPADEEPVSTRLSAFTFPRGPAAGTCLHAILEELDFTGASGGPEAVVERHLAQAGMDRAWQPVVSDWMENILDTDLGDDMRLRLLRRADRRVEMGFHFPLAGLELERFNQIVREHGIRPLPRDKGTLRGLMKGYIDLVFRFRGRYFLADYKSNYLGGSAADYAPQRLGPVMDEHRYDLQCLIYTLALHRYLAGRIADYDYDRHFGGGLYLFLRGMHPDHDHGTGIRPLRPPAALVEALDRCCRGEQ